MMIRKFLFMLMVVLAVPLATVVVAKEAEPIAGDPVLQARVMALSAELRCLVCQGQSLADSNAEFALDMRDQIRELMVAGSSDSQVVDFLVERYGETIRYRPSFSGSTVLLWLGPLALLPLALIGLYVTLKRRNREITDEGLSEADHKRAQALLKESAEKGAPKA